MFAEIILSIKHSDIDKIFDYHIPKHLEKIISCGMRVVVPFGHANIKTEGFNHR